MRISAGNPIGMKSFPLNVLMLARFQPSPFIRDLLGTFVTSVVTVLCLVLITRLLAEGLGAERFGAYSLARRIVSTLDPLVTLAMGVTLTRYVAMSCNQEKRAGYLFAGIFLGVIPAITVLCLGLIFAEPLAQLLFRDGATYQYLYMATLCLIVAYSFYIVLYAYYRGIGWMYQTNVWQVSVIGIGPLGIAWIFARSGSVELIVLLMAGFLACAMLPLAKHAVLARRCWDAEKVFLVSVRELVRYGLPRVPGGLAFGGILAVGPLLAPYFSSLKETGYLVVGQMILRVIEGGTEAFGRAAFPRVAKVFSAGGKEALKDSVADLVSLIFHVGLYGSIHLLIWSGPLVLTWLGSEYSEAIPLIRVTLLALVPYLAFVTLRSVVDAVEVKAVTTFALFVSLSLTIIVSWGLAWSGLGSLGLALGTAIGLTVLGGMVCAYVWREFAIDRRAILIGLCVATNAIFGVISLTIMMILRGVCQGKVFLWAGLLVEGGLFVLYVLSLRSFGVRWIWGLERRIIQSRASA